MRSQLSYCGQAVQENDRDRFLLSLFAPEDRREALWALFAFNFEISKTREVVSEAQLGLIRLQWWRERIGDIFERGEAAEHEVLQALAKAIKDHDLQRGDFETLIYAREFDLENVLPANVEGMLNYADFTNVPLMKLATQVTGGDPEYEPTQAVGVNYGLMGILRAVPFHAQQRRCYLPDDLMKKHKVTLTQLYDFLKPEEGMKDLVKEAAGYFTPGIKPENRFLRASQKLAGIYRAQLRRNKYDPFSPLMAAPPAFKELRLWAGVNGL